MFEPGMNGKMVLEMIRDAACDALGDDGAVDNILAVTRSSGSDGDLDRRETLFELIQGLFILYGDYQKAAEWLFRRDVFGGDSPYEFLEKGDFWTLDLMNDWIGLLVTHKDRPEDIFTAVFGSELGTRGPQKLRGFEALFGKKA